MRLRGLLSAFILGALALTACTAIVSSNLSGFSVSDQRSPSSSSGGNGDPCALVDGPDAGNACSQCIEQNCQSEVLYACDGGPATEYNTPHQPWFSTLQHCAKAPVDGFNGDYSQGEWGCNSYLTDAGPLPGDDPTAHERSAALCVRDRCLQGPTPPCHQCAIAYERPGGHTGYAQLDDSQCGQCIRQACPGLLVQCCDELPEGLKKCSYPAEPSYQTACLDVFDAGPDAKVPNQYAPRDVVCAYQLATQCNISACVSKCQGGL